MTKCLTCEQGAKFKKIPGYISLITDGDSFVCKIEINGQVRRLGAQTLELLYETIIEEKKKREQDA